MRNAAIAALCGYLRRIVQVLAFRLAADEDIGRFELYKDVRLC